MHQLAGPDNPTFLTPPTFWVSVAVAMLIGIAIGMSIAIGIARSRALTPATTLEDADGALLMPHELRRALNRDEFVLHYQPKIELGTGRVNCLEALLRWRHPERGLLAPAEFLSVAEQDPELIDPLTSWVLRRALADYTAWTAAGHDWTVAVNLSARNLGSLEFAGTVGQILQDAGVRPDRLNLEVSEPRLRVRSRAGRTGHRCAGRTGHLLVHRRLRPRLHDPVPAASTEGVGGQD